MKRSKLPIQAAPVERTIAGTPTSSENGIDPSWSWSDLWDTAKKVGGALLN